MRVGHRLFLTAAPAIVGLFTVVALMYFGEYARQAPEWLVALALVASLGSALLARRNARYIAERIEVLAAHGEPRTEVRGAVRRASALLGAALRPGAGRRDEGDELDDIAALIAQLTDALSQERRSSAAVVDAMAARRREYEALVLDAVKGGVRALEEVRLPLHILLENRFGELNENQEEMLGAARSAADAADTALLCLRDVVLLDAGSLVLRQARVHLQDVIASLLPTLNAAAAEREVRLHVDLPPALPAILGDRGRLQESLSTLLHEAIRATAPHGTLTVRGSHDRVAVQLMFPFLGERQLTDAAALATRVIQAHGGRVDVGQGALTVRLPVSGARRPVT